MKETKLTKKEAYLIWAISCQFGSPVTNTLKHKLYNLGKHLGITNEKRNKMHNLYDNRLVSNL